MTFEGRGALQIVREAITSSVVGSVPGAPPQGRTRSPAAELFRVKPASGVCAEEEELDNRKQWIGANPTWVWAARQVGMVLGHVTWQWSHRLGKKIPYRPPPLLRTRQSGHSAVRQEYRDLRLRSLLSSPVGEVSLRLQPTSRPDLIRAGSVWADPEAIMSCWGIEATSKALGSLAFEEQGEVPATGTCTELGARSLMAAMVRRAFLDYANGVVSPLAGAQRHALNAYWWIQGLPFLLTHKIRRRPDAIRGLIQNQTERMKAADARGGTSKSYLSSVGLDLYDLSTLQDVEPYYPEVFLRQLPAEEAEDLQASAAFFSFRQCCHVLGLNLNLARQHLHLLPPKSQDTGDGEELEVAAMTRHPSVAPLRAEGPDIRGLEVPSTLVTCAQRQCGSCKISVYGEEAILRRFGTSPERTLCLKCAKVPKENP